MLAERDEMNVAARRNVEEALTAGYRGAKQAVELSRSPLPSPRPVSRPVSPGGAQSTSSTTPTASTTHGTTPSSSSRASRYPVLSVVTEQGPNEEQGEASGGIEAL